MPQLPSGTVTFLFTDIEGSTKLLEELGDAYRDALAEHRDVIRESFGRHGGTEVDTQGDAFFIAFARASDAVAAAEDAQAALAAGPVRVRMGLHTGEPSVTPEGYVGIDVHRAARIGNSANGDQIVISPATRQLLGDSVDLRDLGEHRLKDFPGATRLFQVGQREFPPLRTPDEARLPLPASPLVGRKKELGDALRLLDEGVRLLTVTGPGGVGKTRLAVEAATESLTRFTDGVRFADLSPLSSADGVLPAIAQTVRTTGPVERVLREQDVLLVLDNAEHVTDAAPDLGKLLDECRGVSMLVTSREPLHLSHERELPLGPMAEAPAVELFRQRVQMTDPYFEGDYETSVEICDRLDGLPLAIELAAARVKALGEQGLLERLDQRLPLLTGRGRDVPERQRTLRAAIEWSYDLLAAEEQRVFAELAIFVGGFTLSAAEAVTGAELDVVESLILKSLVGRDGERLTMLETIREFALERLASADEAAVRRRHAEHYLSVVAPLAEVRRQSSELFEHKDRIYADYENLMAALAWFAKSGDAAAHVRFVRGLFPLWYDHGPLSEAHRLAEEALARYTVQDELRASGLFAAATLAWRSGRASEGVPRALELVEIARGLGNPALLFEAILSVATTADNARDFETADRYYSEAELLARESGSARELAMVLHNRGNLSLHRRDLSSAKNDLEEAVKIMRANDLDSLLASALIDVGFIALADQAGPVAAGHFSESLALAGERGLDELVSWGVLGVAAVLADRRAWHEAATLWGAGTALQDRLGMGNYSDFGESYLDQTQQAVREGLGEDTFSATVEAGRSLPRAQAIELALGAVE